MTMLAEIDFIARQSEFSVKKSNPMRKCKSMSCIISGFDDRISWIQCDSCKLWFHMLCEGVVTSDFSKISAVRLYKCLCCRKIVSNLHEMIPFIASTLEALRDNQASVEQQFHSLSDECLLFKQQLLTTLDDLGVIRQAYHGNMFGGNHCKIILNNCAKVCAVISNAAP